MISAFKHSDKVERFPKLLFAKFSFFKSHFKIRAVIKHDF